MQAAFKKIETLFKTVLLIGIVIAAFALPVTLIYIMGEAYRSLRIYYVGQEEKSSIVSCNEVIMINPGSGRTITTVEKYCMVKLQNWPKEFRVDVDSCSFIGDSLRYRFICEMNEATLVYGDTIFGQAYRGLGKYVFLVGWYILMLIPMFSYFTKEVKRNILKVYNEAKGNYALLSEKPKKYVVIYYNIFIAYQLIPSFMVLLISWIVFIKISQGLLLVENISAFMCGLVITMYVIYLFFLSPKLIYWLHQLKYGNSDVLIFLRTLIQIILFLLFVIPLSKSLWMENLSFNLTWDSFWNFLGFGI